MTPKIKIITGFRKDQQHTIDLNEAHKAYHLFLNPEKRAIFGNGVAIRGTDIQSIEPDYHATMGWNSSHTLDGDDWHEIRQKGVDFAIRDGLAKAKEIAIHLKDVKQLSQPLSEVTLLELN